MNRDWGSRDPEFTALTARLRDRLNRLGGGANSHDCVLLAGSGTAAVEAALDTLVPRSGHALVLVNGAYGWRMAEILRRLGRSHTVRDWPEHEPVDPDAVAVLLDADPTITDVALVQCETTSGIANPTDAVAEVVRRAGRRLLVDAMSAFGILPVRAADWGAAAVMASSNKGLEGVPGIGFVLAERTHLAASAGNASSLSLDLHDQARGFAGNGQWRFTPPVQVAAALDAALDQLDTEGGPEARAARYRRLHALLVEGMEALGFRCFLPHALQAPTIVTFRDPGPPFDFAALYAALAAEGILLYPGKLTREPSFRIGCIGAIDEPDIRRTLDAIGRFVAGSNLRRGENVASGITGRNVSC